MLRKLTLLAALLMPSIVHAETGYDAWLRYAALDDATAQQYRNVMPASIAVLGDNPVEQSAREELIRGIRGMLGRTLRVETNVPNESAVVLGTLDQIRG